MIVTSGSLLSLATGQSMSVGATLFGFRHPSLAAQELDCHQVAGVQPFYLNRHIDQAIGLDH
jgi:hypothetical protein